MFVYRVDMGEPGDGYAPVFFDGYGDALKYAREINSESGFSSSVVEISIDSAAEAVLLLNNLVSDLVEPI